MLWIVVISVALCLPLTHTPVDAISQVPPPSSRGEEQFHMIRDKLSDGKKRLAQSFLKRELRNRAISFEENVSSPPDSVSVSPPFTWKLGTIKGSTTSTFRSFNQSFILVERVLYSLQESDQKIFRTEPVAQFDEFLGEVVFVESVEWNGLLYLLAAYQEGLMQLFTVTPDNKVVLRQSIDCYGKPSDAEFFMQDENLFLVVAAHSSNSSYVPVVVYQWLGSHLDEKNRNLMVEATAVSTFSFQESVIIVVAVNASSQQKAGLAILRRTGSRLEKVQFVATLEVSSLQHFTFKSENYVLVTSNNGPSSIFWWAGTEMILWDTYENVGSGSVQSVGVGYVHGETIILLAHNASVSIFRPTATALQLIDTHPFNSSVLSASLYVQGESIFMLVITESAGTFVPYVVELQLLFQPATISHSVLVRDPLLQCISELETDLQYRRTRLQNIESQRKFLLQKNIPGVFNGKLVVQKLVQHGTNIRSLQLKPDEAMKDTGMSARDLQNEILRAVDLAKSLQSSLQNVVLKSLPSTLSGRLVADDLVVINASMDSVEFHKLNRQNFDPKNILMCSKDQKFTGKITAEKVVADSITVRSLNSIKVDDLLRKRGNQIIHGLEQVTRITADNIILNALSPVNHILLNRVVTIRTPDISITGVKTFANLNLQQLIVGLLNNVNFTEWISSLQPERPITSVRLPPSVASAGPSKFLHHGDLNLANLTVKGQINGVPFEQLVSSLFLKGISQNITGDVQFMSELTVGKLIASKVNGVPTASLMTRNTNQVVIGSLFVESLSVPDLMANSVNGLVLSRDAAYLNSAVVVSTPVVFQSLQSSELKLPSQASIAGVPIGKRLLYEPKIVYEGSVKVKGTLKLSDVNLKQANVVLGGTTLDMRNLHLRYWTKNSDQIIRYPVQAHSGLNVKTLSIATLNGIPVESFVDLTTGKVLQGSWNFSSIAILGNLNHELDAAQLPVPPKELSLSVVKTTGDYIVSGMKVFVGGLKTKNLNSEYIDYYRVLDFVGKSKSPRSGDFHYDEINIIGDLIVHSDLLVGSVNGINLCDRLSKALLIDRPGHIPAASISAVTASNIDVKTFNRVPFDVIGSGHNDKVMPRVRKISIKGDVNVPALMNVMTINGKSVTADYLSRVVDRTKSGVIRGKKKFASQLTVEGSFDAKDYDGENIQDLFNNVLSKTRDQAVSAKIWMRRLITSEISASSVNGILVSDLLTFDLMSRQIVEGDLIFTNDLDVMGILSTATFESGCNLTLVSQRLQVLDGRHWASMTVQGNLDWNQHLPLRVPGLSYYLASAVTKNSKQIIVGEVVFNTNVSVNNFESRKDINDVDITGVLKDSLRKSLPDQVIYGTKIFTSKLYSTSMSVMGNVVAKTIAGLDIVNFNNSLVRFSGDQEIHGKKQFLQGFTAKLLKVDGTVNGLVTSHIANFDLPKLPPMNFVGPVEITGDLHLHRVNDFSLDELLRDRVTLDTHQQLEGHITFATDLSIEGDMVVPSINQVDLGQIIEIDSMSEQVISGKKQFSKSLKVDGPMEVDYLDSLHLRNAYNSALLKDVNATIYGNLVFKNIVNMASNLDVSSTVNAVKVADLAKRLRTVTPRSLLKVRSIARTINDTNALLKARGDLSEFLYLEPVLETPTPISNTDRVVATVDGSETHLDVYGWTPNTFCGLPETCSCPSQYSLDVRAEGLANAKWRSGLLNNSSRRTFQFHLNKASVTVFVKTNSVSSSSQCRLSEMARMNENTYITWIENGPKQRYGLAGTEENTLHLETTPILGYVTDVKVLTAGNSIYLVVGIGYNADLDTTDVKSAVYRLDRVTKRAILVSEFPTHGVSVLDVFYNERGPHIVVGNSFDTSRGSSQVYLDIYSFEVTTEQLLLVKSVPADGVISVASIVQGGDSLIVIAQKQLYAPVVVLKYDPAHKDYHFMQQLNPNTIPTGLGVFYAGQPGQSDALLGVSTADDQFYLYKFYHIEGFKLITKMEIEGVKGFTMFSDGLKQYLFFTSSKSSSIFEVVKQSS